MTRKTIAPVLQTLRLRPTITPAEARSAWSRADVRGLDRLIAFEGAGSSPNHLPLCPAALLPPTAPASP